MLPAGGVQDQQVDAACLPAQRGGHQGIEREALHEGGGAAGPVLWVTGATTINNNGMSFLDCTLALTHQSGSCCVFIIK